MKAMVIGAGIGGLATALSLHAAGIEVQVFESVPDIKPLGVGINLQPNAVRELTELGLGDALASTAIETKELRYYNKHGQLIWSEPRGLAAGYEWPQYSIGRGALQMMLLGAARERIGDENVFVGRHLIAFEQDGTGVNAHFVDPRNGKQLPPRRASVLIGCDGIHSVVRAQLYPCEGVPVSSGYIQWRGAVEGEPFLGGRTHVSMGFSDRRAVVYPISREAAARGRSRINWVAVLPKQLRAPVNWNQKVCKERFFYAFRDWNFDWIKFADLIRDTQDVYEFPEEDRDPLPRWSFGRVTLLGDAAHPMRPIGAQAGSQAIVDGRLLAFALATTRTAKQALEVYDRERRPIMNSVTVANRKLGPARVLELAEQRAPRGFDRIEDIITRRELEEISLSYKVAAGFDPTALNRRPSSTVRRAIRFGS